MLNNIVVETNNTIVAQKRLFINVGIAMEVFLLNSNNQDRASEVGIAMEVFLLNSNQDRASEVSCVFMETAAIRTAMYERQDRFYSWHHRRSDMQVRASRRLATRLFYADQNTRPYNPDSLGHLYRIDSRHIKLRRPFAALADAVRSTIKAARVEDRAGTREGKQRLFRMTFDTNYAPLVFQVMEKHWPALHTAVNTARSRFNTGHWQEPVWTGALPSRHDEHFVHASRETPGNVAFYADAEKLEADKLTSMKPGRYLAAFYGDILSADEIKQWANKQLAHTKPVELKFVGNDDPLGWVWVYENSAASCMRYNRSGRYINSELKNDKHPVTVYAHPENNLALAYMMLPGEVEDRTRYCDTDGYIVGARAIVNKARKTYLRVYGACDVQSTAMKEALERAGYTRSGGALMNEKLRLVEVSNGYLCPYLDGYYEYVEVHSSHLLIGSDGVCAHETSGYVCEEEEEEDDRRCCDHCGESVYEDDGRYVASEDAWVCGDCISEHFVYAIGRRGTEELYRDNDDDIIYYEHDGRYYVTEYLGDSGMGVTEDGEVYPEEQLVETEDGVYHSRDAVVLTYEFNGYDWAHRNDVYHLPNGETCHVDDADKIAEIEALEQEAA